MLYETLKQSWSCSDQTHLRHWVKLCIDSETESQSESVTLDMAIACDINGQGKRYVSHIIVAPPILSNN